MKCPRCGCETHVADSRTEPGLVRRRRACDGCGHRFTTSETMTAPATVRNRRERQRLWAQQRRASETPEQRAARIKRWKTRRAARIEAAQTGVSVQDLYERWGVA